MGSFGVLKNDFKEYLLFNKVFLTKSEIKLYSFA
jgi:hypothetical protein